jgi:hypothetical protein
MKNLFLLIAVLISFSAFSQLSDEENNALNKLIKEQIEIEADALKSAAVEKVFNANFFKITRTPHYNSNGGFSQMILMKHNGKMQEVVEANMLLPVLKSNFKISDNSEARDLKEALTILLAMTSRTDEIVQKDTQWILVCEERFGEKNGFVITTNNNGKVLDIEYASDIQL